MLTPYSSSNFDLLPVASIDGFLPESIIIIMVAK
jgi:hypothetical protein